MALGLEAHEQLRYLPLTWVLLQIAETLVVAPEKVKSFNDKVVAGNQSSPGTSEAEKS